MYAQGPPVSDDFNAASLNTSLWTVVNPVGDGTVSLNGSEALLKLPAGTAHDLWTGGNQSLRILQPIANGDFYVEAKFDSAIPLVIQDEGLIVAQDAKNYIRFDIYRGGSVVNFFSASFVNNNPKIYANTAIGSPGAPIWIRVQRQGNAWTASYSTDGTNYTTGAAFSYTMTAAQIGPFAANNGSNPPAFTAAVDYFHNLSTSSIPAPDLTLTKSHSGSFTAGSTGSYTLTANNAGTAGASGPVTVVDTVPSGLTPTGAAGSGWSCSINAQKVTCTSTAALGSGSSAPPITLAVNISSSASGTITNTATVSGGGETNTANDAASDPTTIGAAGAPDLTLTKSHAGSFTQGGTGSYTLIVKNVNTAASSGAVTVTDPVPSGLTPTAASGSGWSCTLSGQTVTCASSTSIAGSSSSSAITLAVNIASNAPSNLTNTATVSGGGETNTANDAASDPTTIGAAGAPDLTLTKSHAGSFTQGGTGSYTLVANNSGTVASSGTIKMVDSVPSGLTPTAASGSGWSCSISSQTVTCTSTAVLAAASSASPVTLAVNIASDAPSSLTNTATVSGGGETNTGNDSASDPTTIGSQGGGGAQGSPVSDDFNAASLNTSLWTVVNPVGDGTVSLNGSEALLKLPAGTAHDLWTGGNQSLRILQPIANGDFYVEAKFDSGLAGSIEDEGLIVATDANNYLRFDVYLSGSTANFFSASFVNNNPTVYANTAIATPGALWIRVQRQGNAWTASYSTDGTNYTTGAAFSYTMTAAQIGPFAANNGSNPPAFTAAVDYFHNLSTSSIPAPDLTLTKSHSGSFTAGSTGSYTLTANNAGTAGASGPVTVVDTVPSGLTPTGAAGSGWSCSINAQKVTCTSTAALGSGSSAPPITLAVNISSSASGTITNTATVSGGGETNTANDAASDPTTIGAAGAPDLTLTKSHAGSFTQGGTGSYTLIVKNVNTAASSGAVTVTDPVPSGLTPTAASGSGWSCTLSGQTVTCASSTSIAGSSSSSAITLAVNIASNAPSNLTNTATVSGGGETNTANDAASDPTTIGAAGAGGAPVSDDFHSTTLNTGLWTFVNPVGDGSVRLNGTHALLSVPAGNSHDVWTSGNNSARILQSVSNSDFDVQVKFDSAVDQACQTQGLLVQQDDNNYMRFDVYSNGPNVRAFSASFANGSPTVQLNSSIGDVTPVPYYLRVIRSGNTFTYQRSTNGSNWTTLASFSQTLNVKQIGPFASNNACGFTAPAFTASVDFFFSTSSPIVPQDGVSGSNPVFSLWYGDNQTFGNNGIPQTWVNVLGNVLSPNGAVSTLQYTLNGGPAQPLSVGATSYRLPQPGDFDIEIPYSGLNSGANTVVITATDVAGHTSSHTVTVNYVSGHNWPLPYTVNWTASTNPQSVLQIIDGNWQVQPDGSGIRDSEVGYDRLLTIGDTSTWNDYVVTAEVTLHYISDPNIGPPANHIDSDFGVGIIMGWHGHTPDIFGVPENVQPNLGHPFPAVAWYSSVDGYGSVLQLYQNTASHPEQVMAYQPSSGLALQFETKYIFKAQVTLNTGGTSSHFAFKVWPSGTLEPSAWNVQSDGDVSQGSIVLAAHRSDVTFGQISVSPLP